MTPISLAHLTVLNLAPPEMIRLAAEVGYDRVGLRLIRVTDTTPGYPLHLDRNALRATHSALIDTGITVNDIEFVRLTPDFNAQSMRPFLEAGAALGARHVICAPYDPELSRLSENLAALHLLARPYGLSCVLEFFPWTNVPDLRSARTAVERTGTDDIGILVDTLHFNRSDSSLEDLEALPPSRLPFLHLSDAAVHPPYSMEELLLAGRAERLPPGEGQIDLKSILANLPMDLPIALEVPMARLQALNGNFDIASRTLKAARQLLLSSGRL